MPLRLRPPGPRMQLDQRRRRRRAPTPPPPPELPTTPATLVKFASLWTDPVIRDNITQHSETRDLLTLIKLDKDTHTTALRELWSRQRAKPYRLNARLAKVAANNTERADICKKAVTALTPVRWERNHFKRPVEAFEGVRHLTIDGKDDTCAIHRRRDGTMAMVYDVWSNTEPWKDRIEWDALVAPIKAEVPVGWTIHFRVNKIVLDSRAQVDRFADDIQNRVIVLPHKLVLRYDSLSGDDIAHVNNHNRKLTDCVPVIRIEKMSVNFRGDDTANHAVDRDDCQRLLTSWSGLVDRLDFKYGWWGHQGLPVLQPFCGIYQAFGLIFRTGHQDSQLPYLLDKRLTIEGRPPRRPWGESVAFNIRNVVHHDDWPAWAIAKHTPEEVLDIVNVGGYWRRQIACALLEISGRAGSISNAALLGEGWYGNDDMEPQDTRGPEPDARTHVDLINEAMAFEIVRCQGRNKNKRRRIGA